MDQYLVARVDLFELIMLFIGHKEAFDLSQISVVLTKLQRTLDTSREGGALSTAELFQVDPTPSQLQDWANLEWFFHTVGEILHRYLDSCLLSRTAHLPEDA